MKNKLRKASLFCAASFLCLKTFAATPTFQALMDPAVFPEPQQGMVVERAEVTEGTLHVITTGAEFSLNASGEGTFRQRIGHERECAQIKIQGVASPPELTHAGPGLAFARYSAPKLDIRANGDSLFMFHAHEPVTLEITRGIDAIFSAACQGNCLLLDEWGGFGMYCSEPGFGDTLSPYEKTVARYTLPADAVLWIGVCPPKPYDWERSFKDHWVWHWSMQTGYPSDDDLTAWAREGNLVLLQSEVMLWKDWNLAFEPRLGEAEFNRVRETIHRLGMRFIVYTSPYYFLKETPLESKAMNNFDHFSETGFPPGWPEGNNIDLFIAEIEKVMKQYRPDGLYFDGQYMRNVPGLYELARRSRAVVGETGLLEWHSTVALGEGLCFLPQADAYVDFILRGEAQDKNYERFDYLRYFVSCYNTSNSIGVLCNNGPLPTAELVARLVSANCRMHTIYGWLGDPALMEVVHKDYRARLTPAFREEFLKESDVRQTHAAALSEVRAAELRTLRTPPEWGQPTFEARGESFLQWTPNISPQNTTPFAVQDGALAVTAKAHTCAYFSHPLAAAASGFEARMKQGSDMGMSWGIAVGLEWKNGSRLRTGLRSDGLLQVDLNGSQSLSGKHDTQQWIWVRARWGRQYAVVETSGDGKTYEIVRIFEHGGTLTGPVATVFAGKVPCDLGSRDHWEAGPEGTGYVDWMKVY